MAKAQIKTPEGLEIKVEGTPKEVAAVVRDLRKQLSKPRNVESKTSRILLTDHIASLADGGFFKKPRDLAAIKATLEETGHRYPVTTLSGAMLRKVRKKELRRLRQNKRWVYTK
jgi:hypothetical protein